MMKITNPKTQDELDYSGLLSLQNKVFCNGQLKNSDIIELPYHWNQLIDEKSISVHLTPVGANQNIFVKGVQDNKVMLTANLGFPINCYYMVIATLQEGVDVVSSDE